MSSGPVIIKKIAGKSFKVLSLEKVFRVREGDVFFNEGNIKKCLAPLKKEFEDEVIEDIEGRIKNIGLKLFDLPTSGCILDFKPPEKEKYMYRALFQKEHAFIFVSVLRRLSQAEERKIKKSGEYTVEEVGEKGENGEPALEYLSESERNSILGIEGRENPFAPDESFEVLKKDDFTH